MIHRAQAHATTSRESLLANIVGKLWRLRRIVTFDSNQNRHRQLAERYAVISAAFGISRFGRLQLAVTGSGVRAVLTAQASASDLSSWFKRKCENIMASLKKTITTATFLITLIACPWPQTFAQTRPAVIDVASGPIPMQILVQSPRKP